MNPGAQNGIVGNNFGVEPPQAEIPKDDLTEEKKVARFSKTAEFQKLKSWAESRIEYYQKFLPDGREVDTAPTGENWVVANTIIKEFRAMIDAYENVAKVVDEANKNA